MLQKDAMLGLDLFVKTVQLAKEHRLVEDLKQRHDICGNTYSSTTLAAAAMMNTIESRNMQTISASNFKDYGIEPFRLPPVDAFTERGIFNSDGLYWEHSRALRPLSGIRSTSEPCQRGKVWTASEEADQYHPSRWIYNWSASPTA